MKKNFFILGIFLFFVVLVGTTYAQNADSIIGTIKPPPQIPNPGTGASGINTFIQRVIQLLYMVGAIAFIFMLLWGALSMILNAGDKEAVGNARKRIVTAIIGITLLALAFPIMRILEAVLGIRIFF